MDREAKIEKWELIYAKALESLHDNVGMESMSKAVYGACQTIQTASRELGILQRIESLNDTTNKQIIEIRWQESEPDDTEPKCDQPVGQTEAV